MEALLNSPKTTVYTDQHAFHGPALAQFAKKCWRRFCLMHLIRNLPAVKDSNGWVYQAAREPTERWAHHAGPSDTVIGDQTTSNPVEANMSMVGKAPA
ncbi:unnamed protein product [Pylaiella littoralis]